MTPEELEALVDRGDAMQLAEAAASFSEGQRRRLAKAAAKLPMTYRQRSPWSGEYQTAVIAALAFCSRAEAYKLSGLFNQRYAQTAFKVLADRRPEWIDDWVARSSRGR